MRFNDGEASTVSGSAGLAYTRWSNIQADYVDEGGLPSTANIGDGRIISLSNLVVFKVRPEIRFDLSSTFNDGRVTNPSPTFLTIIGQTGQLPGGPTTVYAGSAQLGRIPNVARFTARAGLRYDTHLRDDWSLSTEASARYVGKSRLGAGPVLGGAQGNYVETNASVRLTVPAMAISISLSNLFDAVGNRFALGTPFAIGNNQITPLRPRTIRIGIEHAF